jgi:hypothetical protein
MGSDSALLLDDAKDMKRKIEKPDADHDLICDVLQNLMEREVPLKVISQNNVCKPRRICTRLCFECGLILHCVLVQILIDTEIGKTVKNLRKHSNPKVKALLPHMFMQLATVDIVFNMRGSVIGKRTHAPLRQVKEVADQLTTKWKTQVAAETSKDKPSAQTPSNKKSDEQNKSKNHTPKAEGSSNGALPSTSFLCAIRVSTANE